MRELVATWTASEVEVGDDVYLVPRPSVRQAMTVLASLEAMTAGEEAALRLLHRTCREWLPAKLALQVTGAADQRRAAHLVSDLLTAGLPDADVHEEQKAEVKERAREMSWSFVLSDYASLYSMSLLDVLAMPWPLFITTAAERDRVRAVQELSNVSWYAGAKTGKVDSITRRAGYDKHAGPPVPEVATMSEEERKAWTQRKLHEIAEARRRSREGRAQA